jgi:site-specific DNA-methyltransferase (adenine-specific)
MDVMARLPDKSVDLAIVDPEYGMNVNMNCGRRKHEDNFFDQKKWDKKPPDNKYFIELFRISKLQIIWGANNFDLKSPGWIIWDKQITGDVKFSGCELAYTNFLGHNEIFRYSIQSNRYKESRPIHPTQKPIALYKWLLSKYAKPGWLILDTHVGSASSLIACEDMGFDYIACELDADYYRESCERIATFRTQPKLFEEITDEFVQPTIDI